MKFRMHEDDPRYYNEPFEQFFNNCGSFSTIIHNLNLAFARMGVLAPSTEEADVVGFSSGLGLNFGFENKKRFLIHVWESNELPFFFTRFRQQVGNDYTFFGLSLQIAKVWEKHGFPTEVIDLGIDTEFWKPNPEIKKFDKFTFLSVTACNFRSGINHLLSAYDELCRDGSFREKTQLIIKNTEERATKLPEIISEMVKNGRNITYILERQTNPQLRELYNRSHALVYIPVNTSGGIPILEAAAMELPCIVPDYSPTVYYPHTNSVPVADYSISQVKKFLTDNMGLPYTFPEGMVNESSAKLHMIDEENLVREMRSLANSHQLYEKIAKENRKDVARNWTWDKSAEKIVNLMTKKYN